MRRLLSHPLYDPLRGLASIAAAVVALVHIPEISEHLEEAPYMGVLFVLLTAGCAVAAVLLVVADTVAVYTAVAAVCALAIAGYLATRAVAFPQLDDDVGDWLNPLGIVAVIAEAIVVATAWRAVRRAARRAASGAGSVRSAAGGAGTRAVRPPA